MIRKLILCLPLILLSNNLLAHGGKTHIMGTVMAVDARHVEVKTKEGKTVSILLGKDTKYQKGDLAAAFSDIQVGQRVFVEATGKVDKMTASEIHLAPAKQVKEQAAKKRQSAKP
jgi:preprotein translocase subunit YajC